MRDNTQLSQPAALPAGASVEAGGATARPRTRLVELQLTTLQWAAGMFCAVVGALMLIVPHQFSSPSFQTIRSTLPWVGSVYMLAGVALVVVAVARPRWPLTFAAHLAAGLVLIYHAAMLMVTGTVTGWPPYLVLGLGTLAGGLLARRGRAVGPGDIFAFLMGLCAIANSLVMLLAPASFQLSIYDAVRPYLAWFGAAYLVGGVLLALAQLRPGWPLALRWLTHAMVAAPFLLYMLLVSLPNRGITGMVFYGGLGGLLLLLPWLSRVLHAGDAASLRVRLGLTLVAAAALPLTLIIALVTTRQEDVAIQQIEVDQRVLAATLAQTVADYVGLHRRAVVTLGAQPGLMSLGPEEQTARLRAFNAIYPQFFSCSTYDRSRRGIARSDGRAPISGQRLLLFDEVLGKGTSAVEFRVAETIGRPVLAFGAPARDGGGSVDGVVICNLETTELSAAITRSRGLSDRQVYLVDRQGWVLAHTDPAAVPALTDFATVPPVAALVDGDPESAAMIYGQPPRAWVAGYAPVPELGWGVVAERPINQALAGVHASRELAFLVLLLVIAAALVAAQAAARYLTRPLNALAEAASRLARGDKDAPLPRDGLLEVMHLADSFGQMRDDLTAAAAAREQANQQREAFFSVAAHELKTPLTALLGQAQLFQRRARRDGGLSERDQRSLDLVVAQAERLSALVGDLLDISRLQQGQLALSIAPLELGELVARVVDEIRPALEAHTLTLHRPSEPLPLDGDALRLEQVLQNLIGNATKYSPEGGPVTVTVSREDGCARVSVADRGLGIPAEALPHLFQRFYRAENADPRQISGLGVGLYVVREIVTRHGGRVAVESTVGVGSTFSIWLPLRP